MLMFFAIFLFFIINRNNISKLEDKQLGWKRLKTLNLGGNKLKSIPESFLRGLVYLDTLQLGHNAIGRAYWS